MYDNRSGLIFDMDGTILNSEPMHCKTRDIILARYNLSFDDYARLNGGPTWRKVEAFLLSHQSCLDPHQLAAGNTTVLQEILFDSMGPLPLIEVVMAYHGKRPVAIGRLTRYSSGATRLFGCDARRGGGNPA